MDITSAEITMFQILAGSGRRVIVNRGVVRASGSDEVLEPGCVLQADASGLANLEPWNGSSTPLGVLLEGVTATSSAKMCKVLATGAVKNEHIYIYDATLGKIKPVPNQWSILRASHIVCVGTEYGVGGTISGVCYSDDTPAVELEGVSLICYLTGHSGTPEYGPITSCADGSYAFTGVEPGTAWIIAASLTGHDTETVTAITSVSDNVTDLDIVLDVTT